MGLDLKIIPQYSPLKEMGLSLLDLYQEQAYFDIVRTLIKKRGRKVSEKGFTSHVGNTDGESFGITVKDATTFPFFV